MPTAYPGFTRVPIDDEPDEAPRMNGHSAKAGEGKKGKARQLETRWADDIAIRLDAGGVIDGLLPRIGMSVVYGDSGSGKTFNAIDAGCHVAAGRAWRGMGVEQGAW